MLERILVAFDELRPFIRATIGESIGDELIGEGGFVPRPIGETPAHTEVLNVARCECKKKAPVYQAGANYE